MLKIPIMITPSSYHSSDELTRAMVSGYENADIIKKYASDIASFTVDDVCDFEFIVNKVRALFNNGKKFPTYQSIVDALEQGNIRTYFQDDFTKMFKSNPSDFFLNKKSTEDDKMDRPVFVIVDSSNTPSLYKNCMGCIYNKSKEAVANV